MTNPHLRAATLAATVFLLAPAVTPALPSPPSPVGPEIALAQLEASAASTQAELAATPNGDLLAAWVERPSVERSVLRVRRWGAGGALGAEIEVTDRVALAPGPFSRPDVEADAAGGFVATWTGRRADADALGIFAQRFDAEDRPRGAAFPVSGTGPRDRFAPRLAVAPDGSFVIGWTAYTNAQRTAVALFAHRFAATGEPVGAVVRLDAPGPDLSELGEDRLLGDLEMQPDGTLLAVWSSYEGEGDLWEIFLRRFDLSLAPLDAGNVRVNSDPDFRLTRQSEPALSVGADGSFVIAFSSFAQDGSVEGVYARRFAADGAPLGGEIQVNLATALSQDFPDVAVLPDGGFAVIWQDLCGIAEECTGVAPPGNDGSVSGVFARVFGPDGLPLTGDLAVPVERDGFEAVPRIAAAGGVVAAIWVSAQQDGEVRTLAGRRFAAAGEPDLETLCLRGGRFRATAEWQDPMGRAGKATATRTGDGWGSLAFFQPSADDLVVKLLDGAAINGRFWVYLGSLSDVAFDLRVTDTATGLVRSYRNEQGRFASLGDVDAFPTAPDDGSPPAPPAPTTPSCPGRQDRHCLLDGRFEVEVEWSDGAGQGGVGRILDATPNTAPFWFFSPHNPEVVVKVLDGRPVNGAFWVYLASLTDLELVVRVRDTVTERVAEYRNPRGVFASLGDVDALRP
jgi:hypothetical protein